MKIIMFILLFLFVGAFFIISNDNIKLNNAENVDYFFSLYTQWIDKLSKNSGTVMGYVVKMEWLPGEETDIEFE